VDRVEIENSVTSRQLVELMNNVFNALRSELHTRAIQAAERAVILNAPPATTRSFNRQQNLLSVVPPMISTLFASVEILVKIRHRSLIHVGEIWCAAVKDHLAVFTPHDPRHAFHRLTTVNASNCLR